MYPRKVHKEITPEIDIGAGSKRANEFDVCRNTKLLKFLCKIKGRGNLVGGFTGRLNLHRHAYKIW